MTYYYPDEKPFTVALDPLDFLNEIEKIKFNCDNINSIDGYIANRKTSILNAYLNEKEGTLKFSDGQKYFYESLFIGKSKFRIHFNINKALEIAKCSEMMEIHLETFSTAPNKSANVKFTERYSLNPYNYKTSNEPIIIAFFPKNDFFYLTIDGNHRLTAKANAKVKCINTIILDMEDTSSVVEYEWERELYLFFCNLWNMTSVF